MFLPTTATRRGIILTFDPTLGTPADADTDPSIAVRQNGSSVAPSVTVTNIATGQYTYSYALSAFANGDQINEVITATVDGVSGATSRTFQIDDTITSRPTAAQVRTEMDANSTKLANLDAAVSTRATPAQVNSEADTAIADAGLLTASAFATADPASKAELDAAQAAIEGAVGEGGDVDEEAIADAVWSRQARTLTDGTIRVVKQVQAGSLSVIQGDSYLFADGTHLVITKVSGATWPTDLTGWTITATARPTANTVEDNPSVSAQAITMTGTVVTATGASQSVRLDLAAASSAAMIAGANTYKYDVQASNGSARKTLEVGNLSVVSQQTTT